MCCGHRTAVHELISTSADQADHACHANGTTLATPMVKKHLLSEQGMA
jgi:hypothetical protein